MHARAPLPDWSRWRSSGEAYTIGIEEEVMLLDPADLSLVHEFDSIRPRLTPELAARLTPETHGASVELASAPHARAGEAGDELARLRAQLAEELAEQATGVAASGTHPTATWTDTQISEGERYRYLHRTMRELARREPTHALHVHVGVPDPEDAVEVANRMRAHLPMLLALSANSPFWQGRDSGLSSARTPIFGAFPRVGIPRRFDSYRDYVESLQLLIDCGAFPEPTFVWWDLRLQPRYGTVEIRIMDAQTESWRTTALAALVQCAVRLEAEEGFASEELLGSPELLEENRFLAFRDGIRGELVDPHDRGLEPVRLEVERLVAACTPHAAALGCEQELADVARILASPADVQQREIAGAGPSLETLIASMQARFAQAPRPTPIPAA